MSDYDEPVPEESEQLDQIQADDSLIDRGVSDVLDEGYIAPDGWSPAEGFGNTPAEMRQGETLDMRLAQETPEIAPPDETPWNPDPFEVREVGNKRAGRILTDGATFAHEVGIDGGAATAEEAAMHVIDVYDDDDD
ncbi:MAG: DUF5709 domain-containing protein [Propionibacteriaceae bacterium]|nr:hypothetical protein [Micropruina sp.]